MGGEQSRETKEEEGGERTEEPGESGNADRSGSAGSADTPGELPQCQMGTRRVDNMCFMISCTNWY